ncbi:MAG: hypothetical protein FWF51_11560 [Chitinivibrionia bacterium]|nr:hypothetical protein [Chitinivibrionia bacterium]
MINDAVLKTKGTELLIKEFGLDNASRFFTLIQKEHFDYTKWQETLFNGLSLEEISANAAEYRRLRRAPSGV